MLPSHDYQISSHWLAFLFSEGCTALRKIFDTLIISQLLVTQVLIASISIWYIHVHVAVACKEEIGENIVAASYQKVNRSVQAVLRAHQY